MPYTEMTPKAHTHSERGATVGLKTVIGVAFHRKSQTLVLKARKCQKAGGGGGWGYTKSHTTKNPTVLDTIFLVVSFYTYFSLRDHIMKLNVGFIFCFFPLNINSRS